MQFKQNNYLCIKLKIVFMRFYALILIVLVFGCSNPKTADKLAQVDELMNQHPDSAYALIKSINVTELHGKAEKAFYALLYTQAQSTEIADRIISNARKDDLAGAEKQFDYRTIRDRAKYLETQNTIKNYLIVIITFVLTGVILAIVSALKRRVKIAKERAQTVEQLEQKIQYQHDKFKDLENKQVEYSEKEEALRNIIANRVAILKKLAGIKHEYGATPTLFLKKFDEIILDNQHSKSNANQIIYIANKLNNNIIDKIVQTEPNLNHKELLILSMTCLRFKQLEMCIYLQSPSLDATYMARQRLSKKLKTRSLEHYLVQFGSTI